ncbi:MAG: type IV pili twitching motility protein PilT [Opitutia bacterium TMED102]|nr:type IV pili twitching motility protein PilT [Verrucomicrobiales bacterium]OUV43682.1 MAG: type IV pili twitching motility protein PilT [Opitutae bacterium TMED102]
MSYAMSDLLHLMVQEGGSDLHIRVGVPPAMRLHGILQKVDGPALTNDTAEELMRSITSDDSIQEVRERGGADFAFAFGELARFRVSVFKEKGRFAMVLRQIPTTLLTFEQIGLPPSVKELLYKPRGMVLVTGPTGSGKSTTLASMIDIINIERDDAHIITLEDPIEFYHNHKNAIITQREIHIDVPSFGESLRRALRQDPDVILVGEMRDLETIEAAITAAETGHLVFGTLHTTGAAKTIDRVVNAFPTNQQNTIRIQLSTVLESVISQLLCPRADKPGRVAVFEIMNRTPSIAALIRDNKTYRINSDIQTGAKYGMINLDSYLLEKYQAGLIAEDEVITKAQDPGTIMDKLRAVQAGMMAEAEEDEE